MSLLGMTVSSILAKVDANKPNAYSEEAKVEWLNNVEGRIQLNALGVNPENLTQYSWPEDAETEVIIQKPYADLYEFYLEAMIDFYNKEYSAYENSVVMFNSLYEDYLKYYRRTHRDTSTLCISNIW